MRGPACDGVVSVDGPDSGVTGNCATHPGLPRTIGTIVIWSGHAVDH